MSHSEASSEMVRMILESRIISIAEAFLFDWWGDQVVYDTYILGNNASPASYIASKEKAVKSQIDEYNEFLGGKS